LKVGHALTAILSKNGAQRFGLTALYALNIILYSLPDTTQKEFFALSQDGITASRFRIKITSLNRPDLCWLT